MQYKTKVLFILALLMAVAQGAWADEVKTVLDDGVFTGFTATSGSNTGDGGYDKLVDGNTATKWCTNTTPFYVEFHSSGLIVPTGYIMTTGGDTQSYSGRNPKSWTIKAKVNESDSWTELVSVTDDATMPAANLTPVEFAISGNTTAYKYFRLDVSATRGDSWFQLSEFQFIGTTTDNTNITVNPSLSGSGTSENPYLISSVADWNLFAGKVNDGTKSYSGKFVKLTADISVTTMVGASETNSFQGTFDGQSHTITANINDTENGGTAPFHYINGATIKNLKVAGSITGGIHAAGLVGFSKGTGNVIENCVVSATVSGGTHIGGLLGHGGTSDIAISGCVFSGLMTGGTTAKGALFGWGDSGGTKSVTDCLYVMADGQDTSGLDLVKGNGTVTVTNCYKTTSAGSQGTPAYTDAPSGELSKRMTLQDGNTYYALCTVSGVRSKYLYTGSAITVAPTVTYNGTTLTEGIDYTYATSPATVQEKGDYTLTVTGQGDTYTGTKTFSFSVADGTSVTSDMTTLTGDVFVVNQDVTISSRIQISGDVILVLGEGTTLTAPKGIELSQGNSLTIEGTGALTISDCYGNKSGIGAAKVGTLVINGGVINVLGGSYAAGIGGDCNNTTGGSITINGGVVNAYGGQFAAGIGGGSDTNFGNYGVCGDIVINGGQVTATGGSGAPGVGPGFAWDASQYYDDDTFYNSGTLTISWTNIDDFFKNSGLKNNQGKTFNSFTIADGKQFIIAGTETTIDNTTADLASVLSGKSIWGYNYDRPITLTDGDTYVRAGDLRTTTATYTKTLGEDRVGKRQAWLVPFDYTITADDADNFTFYKINMIANSPDPEQDATNDIWVFLKPMAEGDMLHANMPYVYKPKKAVTDYKFTTTAHTILKAKNTDVIAKTETMEEVFKFYGTYGPVTATDSDPFYYMNINGNLSLGNDGTATVGAFRWIMRVESKFGSGSSAAYARRIIIYDGESETTGVNEVREADGVSGDSWYSLDGRKLQGKPSRAGVYIYKGVKRVIK